MRLYLRNGDDSGLIDQFVHPISVGSGYDIGDKLYVEINGEGNVGVIVVDRIDSDSLIVERLSIEELRNDKIDKIIE
jgi:hypothetical protein